MSINMIDGRDYTVGLGASDGADRCRDESHESLSISTMNSEEAMLTQKCLYAAVRMFMFQNERICRGCCLTSRTRGWVVISLRIGRQWLISANAGIGSFLLLWQAQHGTQHLTQEESRLPCCSPERGKCRTVLTSVRTIENRCISVKKVDKTSCSAPTTTGFEQCISASSNGPIWHKE